MAYLYDRIRIQVNWAKRVVPALSTLPYESQQRIVRAAADKIEWTYERQIGLVSRLIAPPMALFAASLILGIYRVLGAPFLLIGIAVSCTLAWRYERSLLLPRIQAEFGEACANCGYNLTGNASGVCPECGAPCKAADPACARPAAGN